MTYFYDEEECCVCFVRFGVPRGYTAKRRQDKAAFYCPNGHSMSYKKSEADELRRERDSLKQDAARLEDEIRAEREWRKLAQNQARAFKGKVTQLKNRAAAGVCPCCNRSFENLRRHMQAKHKGFALEETAPIGSTVQ